MLPSKRQKHKTKVRQGSNPQYMESFLLHRVNPGKTIKQEKQADRTMVGLKMKSHYVFVMYVKGTNLKQMLEVTI